MPIPEGKEREVRKLLKSVTDLFLCPICCNLLTKPCQTQCRHIFCGPCIKSLGQMEGGGKCPHCRAKLNKRAVRLRDDVTELNLAVGYMEDRIMSEWSQEIQHEKAQREDEDERRQKTISNAGVNKSDNESEDDVDMLPSTPVSTKAVSSNRSKRGRKVLNEMDTSVVVDHWDEENALGTPMPSPSLSTKASTMKKSSTLVENFQIVNPSVEIFSSLSEHQEVELTATSPARRHLRTREKTLKLKPSNSTQGAFSASNTQTQQVVDKEKCSSSSPDVSPKKPLPLVRGLLSSSPRRNPNPGPSPLSMSAGETEPLDLRRKLSSCRFLRAVARTVEKSALRFVTPLDLSSTRKRGRDGDESDSPIDISPLSSSMFKRIKQLQVFEDPTAEIKMLVGVSAPLCNVIPACVKESFTGDKRDNRMPSLKLLPALNAPVIDAGPENGNINEKINDADENNKSLKPSSLVPEEPEPMDCFGDRDATGLETAAKNVVVTNLEENSVIIEEKVVNDNSWIGNDTDQTDYQLSAGMGCEEMRDEPVQPVDENFDIDKDTDTAPRTCTDGEDKTTGVDILHRNSVQHVRDSCLRSEDDDILGNMDMHEDIPATVKPKAVVEKRKFVFCPSRLTRVELAKLSELCSVCDGRISKDYTDEVTHLIIKLERDRVPQTMKYFFAIADKKWVVVYDWVLECVFQGEMVLEEMYETSQFPECDSGVMKSRMNPSPLLTGVNIYFPFLLKSCGASMDDCKKLVTKMGATVIKNPCDIQQNSIVLIIGDGFQNKHIYQEWYKSRGWLSVAWTWIIDCLLSYSIVPFAKSHLLIKLEQSSRVALPEALQRANRSTALSTHFSHSQEEIDNVSNSNSSSGQDSSEHIVPSKVKIIF